MREIILDTETTGLDPAAGHRIVEIACLELMHRVPTGRTYQTYLNPDRDMPADAERVHGLSAEFLGSQPRFDRIADEFLDFIGADPLIIHNAEFDLKFLNAELGLLGRPNLPRDRAIDTVSLARRRFPGAQVSLDALCRRFVIDNSARTFHGALLDCELLAEVYLELRGGRQPGLDLSRLSGESAADTGTNRVHRAPRPHAPSEEELAKHAAMLERLTDPIWLRKE